MNEANPVSGSAGDSPVPSGDPPDETKWTRALPSPSVPIRASATPISLGESPTEAGGSPVPPLPPPRIPDHELLRRIGRGAYGEVWLARSVTGAFRAVKIVRRSSFDHERPFEREFEGILKFEPVSRTHDSQVDILHVGRGGAAIQPPGASDPSAAGKPPLQSEEFFYYVMELADDQATGGQINPDNYHPRTLKSDLLFHSRLSFEQCVSIGIALTTALEHLHQNGLVHRDVKPSNIIFVNGVAKLADIGLVTGVDKTRSYVGTEGFAAPEGAGTAQGDIFSLGKVLYEMSTGKDRQEFPELPTNLRELPEREGLVELNAVIARACRHDARDRYANAAAMRADLGLLQSGKSLARLHRVERRLRLATRAGAAVGALTLLVLAGWFYQHAQTREARRLAEHNRLLAETNHEQVVRFSTANGIRQMESGDLADAMLWFSKALEAVTNDPARAEVHKLRLSTLINMQPKLVAVLPHVDGLNLVISANGKRLLTRTPAGLELWDLKVPLRRIATVPTDSNWASSSNSYHLTPEGDRVIVLQRDRPGQIWTVLSNGTVRSIELEGPSLKQIANPFDLSGTPGILAGITSEETFQRYNLETGKAIPPATELGSYTQRAHSRPGDTLYIKSTNRSWRVLDAASGLVRDGPKLDSKWITHPVARGRALGFSQKRSGNSDIQLFDDFTGQPLGLSIRDSKPLTDWSLSQDMTLLAIASRDRTARVWSLASGDPVSPPLSEPAGIRRISISRDKTRAATLAPDGTMRVWDIRSGGQITPPMAEGAMGELEFAAGDSLLIASTVDGAIRIWDLSSFEEESTRLPLRYEPTRLSFNQRGDRLWGFVINRSSANHQWLWTDAGLLLTNDFAGGTSLSYASSIDDRWLATKYPDGSAQVFDLRTGVSASPRFPLATNLRLWTFSRDANELVTLGNHAVQFWDWRKGTATRPEFKLPPGSLLVWSRSGKEFFLSTPDRVSAKFTVIDLESRQPRWSPKEWRGGPAEFSHDGRRLALEGAFGEVQVIDVRTGEEQMKFAHKAPITGFVFNMKGDLLLVCSSDGEIALWNQRSEKVCQFIAEGEDLKTLAFACEDTVVVASTVFGKVRFWNTDNGEPLSAWLPLGGEGSVVAVHPKKLMLAVTRGSEVVLKDFSPKERSAADLIAVAQMISGRELDAAGRSERIPVTKLIPAYEQLRSRLPEYFGQSDELLVKWHESRASAKEWGSSPDAALIHLDELIALRLDRPELKEQRVALFRLKPLPRNPAAPHRLIDLTDYYNASLDQRLGGDGSYRSLPRGVQELAGTMFDIRGAITLENQQEDKGEQQAGTRISHIRVGQKCKQLHFLHAVRGTPPGGAEVARYIFHFADGTSVDWPMRYGEHVRHYGRTFPDPEKGGTNSVLAWEASTVGLKKGDHVGRLYKTTWPNPSPEVELTHLEFVSGSTTAKPFVVAITAE